MANIPEGRPPEIPNQIPIPQVDSARRAGQASMSPFASQPGPGARDEFKTVVTRTAMINAVLLVAAILAGLVFPVFDNPDHGLYLVFGAAMISGLHMSVAILRNRRRTPAAQAGAVTTAQGMAGDAGPSTPYGAVPTTSPASSGALSFTVDDVFTITGRGTVVTGTVAYGEVSAGDQILVHRGTAVVLTTMVAQVEKLGSTTTTAAAGENAGLLLTDVRRDQITRGDVITR